MATLDRLWWAQPGESPQNLSEGRGDSWSSPRAASGRELRAFEAESSGDPEGVVLTDVERQQSPGSRWLVALGLGGLALWKRQEGQ